MTMTIGHLFIPWVTWIQTKWLWTMPSYILFMIVDRGLAIDLILIPPLDGLVGAKNILT